MTGSVFLSRTCRWALPLALMGTVTVPAQGTQRFSYLMVPVHGDIGLDHARLINTALDAARSGTALGILLDVSGSGGRYDIAQTVLLGLRESNVPVISLVSGRVRGAPLLLALSADSLFIFEQGVLVRDPDAMELPRPARLAIRDAFEIHAMRLGASAGIGAALVDADADAEAFERGDGEIRLSSTGARRSGLATAVVSGLPALLSRDSWQGVDIDTIDAGWVGTTIEVRNLNTRDARVYLSRGTRTRLGNVTSMNTGRFEIPAEYLTEGAVFQVLVEIIGSNESTVTERIRAEPGLLVEWVIEEPIRQSNYFISRRY